MDHVVTRRNLLTTAGILGASTLAGLGPRAAAEEARKTTPEWFGGGPPHFLTPQIVTKEHAAVDISPDGQAMSLLFDTMSLELSEVSGDKMQLSHVVTACFPQTLPDNATHWGYMQILRGFLSKTAGARAAIIADLGGTLLSFEYPYDVEVAEDDFVKVCMSPMYRQSKSQGGHPPTAPPVHGQPPADGPAPVDHRQRVSGARQL